MGVGGSVCSLPSGERLLVPLCIEEGKGSPGGPLCYQREPHLSQDPDF